MRDTAVKDTLGDTIVFDVPHGTTSGVLTVAGQSHPLDVLVTYEADGSARVSATTSFSALGLTAPRLAAGLVVATDDELQLYARVPVARLPVTH